MRARGDGFVGRAREVTHPHRDLLFGGTPLGIGVEQIETQRSEIVGDVGIERTRVERALRLLAREDHGRGAVEGHLAREHAIERRTERIEIRRRGDGAPHRLFGRHVRDRAHEVVARRVVVTAGRLGDEPEVEHHDTTVGGDHHVGRLEVAMDLAVGMQATERCGELAHGGAHLVPARWPEPTHIARYGVDAADARRRARRKDARGRTCAARGEERGRLLVERTWQHRRRPRTGCGVVVECVRAVIARRGIGATRRCAAVPAGEGIRRRWHARPRATAAQVSQQVDAIDELHREEPTIVGPVELAETHEVRVHDLAEAPELVLEAIQLVAGQTREGLERDALATDEIDRLVHDTHTARAELSLDLEALAECTFGRLAFGSGRQTVKPPRAHAAKRRRSGDCDATRDVPRRYHGTDRDRS